MLNLKYDAEAEARVLRQEGRQEGRQEERFKIAERLLRRGRLIDEVIEDTGLNPSEIEEVRKLMLC